MLCNEPEFQVASKDLTTYWNLKFQETVAAEPEVFRRGYRARRPRSIGDAFGSGQDLTKLATGSVETNKVKKDIRLMLAQPLTKVITRRHESGPSSGMTSAYVRLQSTRCG